MSKQGIGKIIPLSTKARTRYAVIPADVAGDDRFPSADGDRVTVRIEEEKRRVVLEHFEEEDQ